MYDASKIILGILIFLVLATSPFWYSKATGQSDYLPDPVILTKDTPGKDVCVMPTDYMRSSHMDLLNDWRNSVVRDGERKFVSPNGHEYKKSLSNTCMDCHANKTEFCDKCHNYMAVDDQTCWSCHVEPKEEL